MNYKTADLHCDTIYAYMENPFNNEKAAWSIDKFKEANGVFQCFAICVLPPEHSDSAMRLAINTLGNFHRKKPEEINLLLSAGDFRDDKINVILSLEGATPLIDDINNLYAYYNLGVRLITLTWNHRNFVADGIGVGNGSGLTDFGKEVIAEMEKLKMIVDVSHLNEAGFKDICEISTRPFAASHSNAYAVMEHPRNLKDWQIREIIERKGFIGINFYSEFIALTRDKEALADKLAEHIRYYLDIGAGDVLGLGADFDGIDHSPYDDVRGYVQFAEMLSDKLKLNDEMIDKIMNKNLLDFVLNII